MEKLSREFYNRDSLIIAKELLGKVLVHEVNGEKVHAKIVETEAYMGVEDKAAHSYGGRRTPRVEVMYGKPGVSYVYFIYGMYFCFNVVTREEGVPQAVLIRALEPLEGLDFMAQNRYKKQYDELNRKQITGLTSGPGKLCTALQIDKSLNGEDLCGNSLYIEEGDGTDFHIVSAKRVGIDRTEEARDYLWRFYIKDNRYVSVTK
ncbi:DNA-3-methyladenine glycosylase [Muricomes intestini]|jgi:DNA-3-methyladenine glycosylase|uniref:Putative 3-methyladenine DNA glycosylase n=1 Tax=Muricomes intestini TaxID=1796634 RepID=A0A4R3KC81_9FIRM|nr:DNA-3-methyladenine glycosylase [Muricomes intestini]TCS80640.1 DNA-3-methyladenine glycosylase [Muricomes intestini]HAX50823.1 DNA-3-methyladenine glycosylase [Lachnospiraceae bacterium]HCR83133.1 DNA-3-methyladenine glycosylase [Lachnospiraceae bacterium]